MTKAHSRSQQPVERSIHPRAWLPGGHKKNTAAPRSARNGGAGGKKLRKALKRLGIRVKAFELLSPTARKGCRKPGSMAR